MKRKNFLMLMALLCSTGLFAQLGIKAGLNMANEIRSFNRSDVATSFQSSNLTGYQIGLVYQAMPKKTGMGVEIGALLSQKGSSFHFDSINVDNVLRNGYKEINYLEVPLNIRYHIIVGLVGVYGFGGVYGACALSGSTVTESTSTTEKEAYKTFADRVDYGYNFGAGVELFRKIQLGGTWSNGIKSTSNDDSSFKNKVFTMNLVYMF
ncbi:MAG: outer membrane beta-barrel protein [Paludibacter sp.]|nr:outer membrane beta-barrel protein [Paludibacter sp.]